MGVQSAEPVQPGIILDFLHGWPSGDIRDKDLADQLETCRTDVGVLWELHFTIENLVDTAERILLEDQCV